MVTNQTIAIIRVSDKMDSVIAKKLAKANYRLERFAHPLIIAGVAKQCLMLR